MKQSEGSPGSFPDGATKTPAAFTVFSPACQQAPSDAGTLHKPRGGLLLDVFAGSMHRSPPQQTNKALHASKLLTWTPILSTTILDDAWFELLLRICWSGSVSLLTLAPPCKEYSRLQL